MINIKTRRSFSDPMDSGSLTDLAFLLIIYFIVIAGFNVNKGFLLNLPEKERPKIVQSDELIKVFLMQDGSLLLNGKKTDKVKLEDEVRIQLEDYPETTLLLSIHPDTPYQKMVDLVYLIRKMKVENFSFKMSNNDPAGENF